MEGMEIEVHPKTIIHIDIDYFYAQVEELKDKSLLGNPVGIKQQTIIVTCNYIAREYGVKKLMLISDAIKLCPNLIIINGEDLTNYKKMSQQIFDILIKFTNNVERLGMDENYMDVTTLVNNRLDLISNKNELKPEGFVIPDETTLKTSCSCGCDRRLIIGTHLAKEIRTKLYDELGITSCAGISSNKLLAKLVGSANKPNNQTLLVPTCGPNYMIELGLVRCITGVGVKMELLLKNINITTIKELQECELEKLQTIFGYETACRLKDTSFGRDYSNVRPSAGRPKTIGLENSCKTISLKADVEEKFRILLVRLVNQVMDDGRIPVSIKIILRKFDPIKKTSHREMKQCNILPSLFKLKDSKIIPVEGTQEKLLLIVMKLFERAVDLKQPFNITLLGLAFTKFQERKTGSCSIANFLIKKSDLEVQSVTSLSNEGFHHKIQQQQTSSNIMEHEQISDTSIASCSDLSETEIEPSPKKTRIGILIAKRRCFSSNNDLMDISSPSKLRVADLRLNSKDSEQSQPQQQNNNNNNNTTTATSTTTQCPSNVDQSVFKELPLDVQNELLASWRQPTTITSTPGTPKSSTKSPSSSSSMTSTLHRYFIKNN